MNLQRGLFIGCASLAALSAACTNTLEVGTAPVVPDGLKVEAPQKLVLEARAAGVQIYDCQPSKDDPARYEFVFRAPQADLFDALGRKIGRHYAGPTWESNDGSKVVGEVKARADAPDLNAIPWLLLHASNGSGSGVLARTLSVQRVHTVGGKAPARGCTQELAGKELRVPYSAMYYFYAASTAGNAY